MIPAKMRPLVPPVVACFLVLLASTIRSIDLPLSIQGHYDAWTYGLISCALYAAVLFLAINRPPSINGLAWLGVALSAHAVIQRAGCDPLVPLQLLPAGHRAGAWVGSPVDLGAILAMLFFFGSWWQSSIMLIGIWATGSRAPWLAVMFGWAAAWWPRRARLIALLAVGLMAMPALKPGDIGRHEVWKAAIEAFVAHPILGTGPDTFEDDFRGTHLANFRAAINSKTATQWHAHNDILQALATTGILGLLAYLWLLGSLPAVPSLVALFVVMKFDPVALEVLALAAMIAGEAVHRGEHSCRTLETRFLTSSLASMRSAWFGITGTAGKLSAFWSRPASSIFGGTINTDAKRSRR